MKMEIFALILQKSNGKRFLLNCLVRPKLVISVWRLRPAAKPTSCLVRKVCAKKLTIQLMNLECRLRVRSPACTATDRSVTQGQKRTIGPAAISEKSPIPWHEQPLYRYTHTTEILPMSPFFSKHEPWILRVYELLYELLPCFVYRILCVHSCVTHQGANRTVLMGKLAHPSHPSQSVASTSHQSLIPAVDPFTEELVHPNSLPFTPIIMSIITEKPEGFCFDRNLTIILTIIPRNIMLFWPKLLISTFGTWKSSAKGQLKAPSFSACTPTWTCPFPNRPI